MPRLRSRVSAPAARRPQPGIALRRAFARGYGAADLKADLLAGAVVGVVALPLSMALAIATGVPPQHGLYTAIVAGALIALLGGSRVQVSGPTAAFVAILAPITARFGLGGLALATVMAGLILILFGFAHFGRFIEFIPHPVTQGFTLGIAVVIATLQLKDFLGLTVAEMPETYLERAAVLFRALPTARWAEVVIGLGTLAVLLLWPRFRNKVPAPLIALSGAAVAAWAASKLFPGFIVETVGTRFHAVLDGVTVAGIPQAPPLPLLPWNLPGGNGEPVGLSLELLRALLPSAFAIAVLGAIESLLSAVVADGMIRGKHDPDEELVAQGVGNVVAPFFGGFAATGAIARTATNVRAGARSPLAAVTHSAVVLLAVLVLAPALRFLPMAALAAQLLMTAWNMSEVKHALHMARISPRSDRVVFATCFALTIVFDMVVAVSVGVVLAALLFMRRMAEVTGVALVDDSRRGPAAALPRGVLVYEVAGPLFFGAAQRAMSTITDRVGTDAKVVLLDLRAAPALDATGLASLEGTVRVLADRGILVILGGLQRQPLRALIKAGWRDRPGELILRRTYERAVEEAGRAVTA